MPAARITEKKRIQVSCDYGKNPFYVRWLAPGLRVGKSNAPGNGWGHWLFQINQSFGTRTQDKDEFAEVFTDPETQTAVNRVLSKTARDRATLYAEQLTLDQVQGLETLLKSPKVEWLYDVTNTLWTEIRVRPGSFNTYESEDELHAISFQIEFNEEVIQSN